MAKIKLLAFICYCSTAIAVAAETPKVDLEKSEIVDIYLTKKDGFPISHSLEIIKGKTVTLSAKALDKKGGELPVKTFLWGTNSKEAIEITDEGGGLARLKALRDWFDENPRREPSAQVMVCADAFCKTFLVTCLLDASGKWEAKLTFDFIGHREERRLLFFQNGRVIEFEFDPGLRGTKAYARLDGNTIKLIRGAGVLVVFEGTASDRENAKGKFATRFVAFDFSGVWSARRSP